MGIPSIPKKPGTFMERLGMAQVEKAIAPRAEVVSFKRHRKLEPWMIATASKGFESAGTVRMVASLLNVAESRLSGWLEESESEECTDELLLSFGDACRKARQKVNTTLMTTWVAHAASDAKACIELTRSLNPELQVTKKVEARVAVSAPKHDYSKLTLEEVEILSNIEMKLLGG